jgi:hypothetical protein
MHQQACLSMPRSLMAMIPLSFGMPDQSLGLIHHYICAEYLIAAQVQEINER